MDKFIQTGRQDRFVSACYLFLLLRFATFLLQIKLLKILALLGSGNKQASEHMYTAVRGYETNTRIGMMDLKEFEVSSIVEKAQ